MTDLNIYFQKHGLCAENILYIYRKDRKTVIQRTDGEEFALFIPVHSVLSILPESEFLSISKGTVVCRSHIVDISKDGIYTMSDGRTFQGRKRGLSSHRRLRTEIGLSARTRLLRLCAASDGSINRMKKAIYVLAPRCQCQNNKPLSAMGKQLFPAKKENSDD